jgi:hypothetical protein
MECECDDTVCNRPCYSRILSLVAGLMCGAGWFVYVDGTAYGAFTENETVLRTSAYSWLVGLGMTIALIMINTVPWDRLNADDDGFKGNNVACKSRIYLIFSLILLLGSMAGGIVIYVNDFARNADEPYKYGGWSIVVQSVLILMGAFTMRAGTADCSGSDSYV